MLEKHRNLRSTLISKIKESTFVIFEKNILPLINVNVSVVKINQWKLTPNVRSYYKSLFRPMSKYTNISYMDQILERIWSDSSVSL